MKIGNFKDALFNVLNLLSKTEGSNLTLYLLETKILMVEIHLNLGSYYEALSLLNKIQTEVTEKTSSEVQITFFLV